MYRMIVSSTDIRSFSSILPYIEPEQLQQILDDFLDSGKDSKSLILNNIKISMESRKPSYGGHFIDVGLCFTDNQYPILVDDIYCRSYTTIEARADKDGMFIKSSVYLESFKLEESTISGLLMVYLTTSDGKIQSIYDGTIETVYESYANYIDNVNSIDMNSLIDDAQHEKNKRLGLKSSKSKKYSVKLVESMFEGGRDSIEDFIYEIHMNDDIAYDNKNFVNVLIGYLKDENIEDLPINWRSTTLRNYLRDRIKTASETFIEE